MHRSSVLERTDCDLRKLPLGAREAFVLAQLDGRLTLEEVGEVAGLTLDETSKISARLVELGAASAAQPIRAARVSVRRDPRAEEEDEEPAPSPPPRTSKGPAPARRSRKSLRPQPSPKPQPSPLFKEEPCELDEATQTKIRELDEKLPKLDHYGKLGVDRGAEKKAIKRAYFAFVAKFHPDRFFGKKLGKLGPAVDRVFQSLTDAHDTLIDPDRRGTYDASLPKTNAPVRRKTTKAAMRAASKKMDAVKTSSIKPSVRPSKPSMRPSKTSMRPSTKTSMRPSTKTSMRPSKTSLKPPKQPSVKPAYDPKKEEDRMKRLVASAREIKTHARVEMIVRAAEEAFANGDVIGAANNYRLALEHREDPYLRNKLEDVEVLAKQARFDKAMARAKAAEKEKKWPEAGTQYARAFEAKPDASAAERAANAMLVAGVDLERALELAERAVSMRDRVPEYRVTLAQVLFAMGKLDRAEEEAEAALVFAPKDARAKDLTKLIAKKRKERED
jgi:curved DNA-binding protein CbpA